MQIFDLPRKSKPQARAKNTRCASNLPSKKLILKYFSEIQPTIKVMGKSKYGPPTFFEICIGLAYYIFAKEKLDYAVMETGLGGKIDATNCVSRRDKVAVITRIGHDHMSLLGNTISKIVNKKCGIIKNQNSVISIRQKAANIIKKKCEEKNSDLFLLDKKNYKIISANAQKTVFDFQFFPFSKKGIREAEKRENLKIKNLNLGLIGKHQAENCSLALACLCLLSKRDRFKINEKNLRKSLENINIPGRFNILKYYGKKVIIDGAHNKQKMGIFTENLSKIYSGKQFDFIVAFKKGKDFRSMLEKIVPLAEKVFLSSLSIVNGKKSVDSVENDLVSKYLRMRKFENFKIIKNNRKEIISAIKSSKNPVVITGSLYFIGSIYPYLIKNNPS
jgi:dihydrofolate synthase/folylpolyglutamate synthase